LALEIAAGLAAVKAAPEFSRLPEEISFIPDLFAGYYILIIFHLEYF
jgi:hypothetical protein